jgi:carbon-monoxide dehydrogenase medium subunit
MLIGQRSRRHIAPFALHRPRAVQDVLALLAAHPSATLLAGGLDVIDRMKWGDPVGDLIDLRHIPGLADIACMRSEILIGAMATHATLATTPQLHVALPDLQTIWHGVANPRIRNTGTIGGNLMAAQPHYDAMPAMLALEATAVLAGQPKPIPLSDLPEHTNAFLLGLRVPRHPGLRLVADRSLHPAIALYAAGIVTDGHVGRIRIAISGAHESPCVFTPGLSSLPQSDLATQAAAIGAEAAAALPATRSDGLGSADWRTRMIAVLARRLLLGLANAPAPADTT